MAIGVFGVWAKKLLKDHSQTELDYLDGVTAGTVTASKAAVVDASKDITGFRHITASGAIKVNEEDIEDQYDILAGMR